MELSNSNAALMQAQDNLNAQVAASQEDDKWAS